MNGRDDNTELAQNSTLIILITFTAFAIVLGIEAVLLHWERWALFLLAIGVLSCWGIHVRNNMSHYAKIWTYSILLMTAFFFYGIHESSTFDLAIVMAVLLVFYTLSGIKGLISLCQFTYYATMTYEIVQMFLNGVKFDVLMITRILLHLAMIFMICHFSRAIIDRWSGLLNKSKEEVESLTDSTKRLNDFLANVSHELRTPVNAIIGLTGICIDKETNPDIRRDMEEVRDAGHRVSEQIGDILDYSEIDRDDLALNSEDYMLSSVLNDLVTEIRAYETPELELIIDVDPAIPAVMNTDVNKLKKILKALISNGLKFTQAGGVYVRITSEPQDYGVNLRIEVTDTGIGMTVEETERIFESFYQVDSGRTRSGGGLGLGMSIVSGFVSELGGFMTLSSKPDVGTTVHVSIPQKVIDPSSCMSLKKRDRLCVGAFLHFDKYPHPNVREYYNSMVLNIVSGLGIQMHRVDNPENLKKLSDSVNLTHLFVAEEEYMDCKELLEELAKTMIVAVVADSPFKLPENSHARILEKPFYCFPVTTILNMDNEDVIVRERMMLKGVKTLVVDDEPMNLTVARSIFKRYGMLVTTAASGPESIELCKNMDFDVVFMDHMMRGMDGIEAMKRIKADAARVNKEIPVIALTANAMSTAKKMFLDEGFDGFVSKPIEIEELERAIKKALPKHLITYENDEVEIEYGEDVSASMDSESTVKSAGGYDETDSSDFISILEAAGVDTVSGLHYCQNDKDFYKTLLEQFLTDMRERLDEMNKYRDEKDYANYAILVHSLKSTSKMNGFLELSDGARELEMAAKENRGDYIEKHHEDVMKELVRILGVVGTAVRGTGFGDAAEGSGVEADAVTEAEGEDSVYGSEIGENTSDEDDEILEFLPEE